MKGISRIPPEPVCASHPPRRFEGSVLPSEVGKGQEGRKQMKQILDFLGFFQRETAFEVLSDDQ